MKPLSAVLITTLLSVMACAQTPSAPPPDAVASANAVDVETRTETTDPTQAPQTHPGAIVYSDAYQTRLKIHKYASYATLPLFAAEIGLGESLYNNPNEKGAVSAFHGVVGAGIVGLFGVNTVTGAWNLFGEGRQDPNGRKLKLAHGILMMVADAGFVATVALAPHQNRSNISGVQTTIIDVNKNRAAHRDVAFGSIGVGTLGYLMMLFGNH